MSGPSSKTRASPAPALRARPVRPRVEPEAHREDQARVGEAGHVLRPRLVVVRVEAGGEDEAHVEPVVRHAPGQVEDGEDGGRDQAPRGRAVRAGSGAESGAATATAATAAATRRSRPVVLRASRTAQASLSFRGAPVRPGDEESAIAGGRHPQGADDSTRGEASGSAALACRPSGRRDAYQKPDEVVAALAFRSGDRVADIGAGSGYFTRRISKAVGPSGDVLAIDIAPDVLEYLEARLRREGLANVRVQRVTADDPQLPPGGVDTILMVDTLHYVKDRATYAKKLRAGLAPGGRVVVVDFVPKSLEERPWGPPPEQKMSREEVDQAMADAGLAPARVHEFLTEQFFVEYKAR